MSQSSRNNPEPLEPHEPLADSDVHERVNSERPTAVDDASRRVRSQGDPDPGALATFVRTGDNWLMKRDITRSNQAVLVKQGFHRWRPQGRMARWSGRLAGAAEASPTMQRFGKAATELVRLREHGMSFSVGVTATDEGNGHPYAAIGLAMTWARWGHRTLLVCTGGRFNEFGHEFNCTTPSIADLFEALAEGRRLPVPPMLMPVITNLEVLSGMGHLTLSRLVETNWLSLFAEAVRSRYDRIIWSLPPMSEGTWTPAMLHQVVDALTLSIRPGRTTLLSVRRLADEVQRAELPPLQVIWQD